MTCHTTHTPCGESSQRYRELSCCPSESPCGEAERSWVQGLPNRCWVLKGKYTQRGEVGALPVSSELLSVRCHNRAKGSIHIIHLGNVWTTDVFMKWCLIGHLKWRNYWPLWMKIMWWTTCLQLSSSDVPFPPAPNASTHSLLLNPQPQMLLYPTQDSYAYMSFANIYT